MKGRKDSALWAYLKASGALDKGEDAIEAARQQYKREYNRRYKAKQRQEQNEVVVSMKPAERERIMKAAKGHTMTIPHFLVMTCLSYVDKVFLSHDLTCFRKIEAMMLRILTVLERMETTEAKKKWFSRENEITEVKGLIISMRAQITKELLHPDLLVTAVVNTPIQWDEIINRINDLKDARHQGR